MSDLYIQTECEALSADALATADACLPGDDICVICGGEPQPIRDMLLLSDVDEPAVREASHHAAQLRVRVCQGCFRNAYVCEGTNGAGAMAVGDKEACAVS